MMVMERELLCFYIILGPHSSSPLRLDTIITERAVEYEHSRVSDENQGW